MEENTQNPQEGENKVEKQYNSNIEKLVALFKGDQDVSKKKRGKKSEFDEAINELISEKKKAKIEAFKTKAAKLLDSKVEFDKFVQESEKNFKAAVLKKKEEFNKEMNDCFQLIEDVDKMVQEYKISLGGNQ